MKKLFTALDISRMDSYNLLLKLDNYESVEHVLSFSAIKKASKISSHRHFKNCSSVTC